MQPLSIAASKDHFVQDGRPFFYLADTVWSALTNASAEDWDEYLDYRKMQGFNALQINILPQWDRSQGARFPEPFALRGDGSWDVNSPNDAYFSRARTMVAAAHKKRLFPALVLLWCNYVQGTWGAERVPGNQIPLESIQPYVQHVCELFEEYQPIFLVSGDTDLKSQEAIEIYITALKAVKKFCPSALTTLHLNPPTDLPEEIVKAPELDFYMYQSGHHAGEQSNSYTLARRFYSKSVKRPIVNGEPCYEGLQFWNASGRISAFDVRKAVWQSLLSGAKAGITYGAHGIWCWHDRNASFAGKKVWDEPYAWKTALRFDGAWGVALAKWLFETYNLFELEPVDEVLNETPEIRMAASPDGKKVAIYIPFNTPVHIARDLTGYECVSFNLSQRLVAKPEIQATRDGSLIQLHPFNSDLVVIGIQK